MMKNDDLLGRLGARPHDARRARRGSDSHVGRYDPQQEDGKLLPADPGMYNCALKMMDFLASKR